MGLDVYLNHCPDRAKAKAAEKEYERLSEAEWAKVGGYSASTEAQKKKVKTANKKHAIATGCVGKYESHSTVTDINHVSKVDPEHLFKIGYLRSSYNNGGFNSVMRRVGLPDLYDIFEPKDRYEFVPDWEACLVRCNNTIAKYEAHLGSTAGTIGIMKIDANMFCDPKDLPQNENDALKIAVREIERNKKQGSSFDGYSNRDGTFYLKEPIKVLAFLPGMSNVLVEQPCCYVAYEKEKLENGKEDWYLTAFKITREMIEYVLAKPDPENYYLHWSS